VDDARGREIQSPDLEAEFGGEGGKEWEGCYGGHAYAVLVGR
jgi:hypothetical protein